MLATALPLSSSRARHGRYVVAVGVFATIAFAPPIALATAIPPFYVPALDGTTVNGRIAGEAILATCITGANGRSSAANNQRFQDDCDLIVGGSIDDSSGSSQALTDIAADQISAQNSVAIRAASLGAAMVQSRLAELRVVNNIAGETSILAGTSPLGLPMSGGGASGDATFGRLGTFLNLRYVTGDSDKTAFQPGYDFDGWTVQGGVDYRFEENLIGGIALRYSDGDSDYKSNRGKLDGDGWGVSIYGSYSMDNGFFVDGLISYAKNDYTLKRNVNYTINGENAIQVAKSDPDADVWSFNVGTGYTFYQESWSITPSLRLNYLQNEVDGFTERMTNPTATGGAMALSLSSQTYDSFTSNLGIQIANAISHKSGVIVPQLRIGWVHEFQNDQERVGARFVDDINNQPLFVLTDKRVSDYADLSLGVSAQFAQGRSAFLSYNTILGYDDVTYNAVNVGARLEF